MVWQYLQIIIRVLWRYYRDRMRYVREGSWLMHRYSTGHLLLSRTIELCEERRKLLVQAERKAIQKKTAKLERKKKLYAGTVEDQPVDSVAPQQEAEGEHNVRQDDEKGRQES